MSKIISLDIFSYIIYIFRLLFLFIIVGLFLPYFTFAAGEDKKDDCKTCSGPSDEVVSYRNFLKDTLGAVTTKKPTQISNTDPTTETMRKNLLSTAKSSLYKTWSKTKNDLRADIHNGVNSNMGIHNFAQNMLSFGNIVKLRELSSFDEYANTINQKSILLINNGQRGDSILDEDYKKLSDILKKYSEGDKRIFESVSFSKTNTYADLMKFLLSINNKLQRFIINNNLKAINTAENMDNKDMHAKRFTGYQTKIKKSYECSIGFNKCSHTTTKLKEIGNDFSISAKDAKNDFNMSINGLKNSRSRFKSVVLGIKSSDYEPNMYDSQFTNKGLSDHIGFSVNSSISPSEISQTMNNASSWLGSSVATVQDTNAKIQNQKTLEQAQKMIIDNYKKEAVQKNLDGNFDNTTKTPATYQVSTNPKYDYYVNNRLATTQNSLNKYVYAAMLNQDDLMDNSLLSQSESITKAFPNLSKLLYADINNLGDRSDEDSAVNNLVKVCDYQCANLGGVCNPAYN